MFALDLFNTDHERRLTEGAVDQLEQRRIDDLAMKMDDLVARARQANTPDAKAALMKEFQKCKSERDSYYKIRNETMGYGTLVGEETHEFKGAHGKLDVERTPGKTVVTRKEYPDSDEMRADRFPNRKLKGQGSGTAIKSGSGASSSQGTMRKMPHLDHDSNDAPNYEVDEEVADQYNTKQVKVFKDKSGKPIGEIGFDLDASPGNDDWYCWHYATGYNVLGFDNAAEATKELRYVHKHPELVSETGIPGNVPAEQIPGKEDLLKGKGRQTYESQKKNSEEVNEGQRLHRGDPVVVTGPNEFEGKTGEIADFSPSGTFVIVDLYNHGKHSMHLSDIAYNEYADQEQDEEDDWYDDEDLDEGFQDFNKVEPYAVCLAGKPIKKFDYYEDARRFHDNWKQKLYREGNQAKADRITLNPIIKEFAPGGIYKPPVIPTNPGKGPFEDDPRSQTVNQVQQLLDAGKSVFVLLPGAKGRAVGTQIGDDHSWLNVQYKGWKDPKTRSRSRLTVNLKADDDASLTLTPGSQFTDNKDRPFDYTLTGSAKTSGRGLFEVTVDEADETSWTANSAQFRKEEDMSWPVEITLEPKDDINKGRGAQVKTMTVTGQSRDAAKKKLVDYYRKNGWEVTGIKFTGDLDESDSGDYDYPYNMSARDKGRYDAMTGREYNNPYSAFGTQEDHNNAIEYSAAYDSANEQGVAEAQTDYSKRRQREKDVDAGKPVARQRQPRMTDYQKKRAQQKKEMELGEESSTSSDDVERAILNRIMVAHTDLLMKFGPEKVMQAAEEVAYNVGDVDEIGTSDVSAYVAQVKQILGVPEELDEKWSQKYKSSINCSNPKGFSQRAHCDSKKK